MTETDKNIKKIWEENLIYEIAHLHSAKKLLNKYEKKDYVEVIGDKGDFPEPISLHENIEYVRDILANTVNYTADKTEYKSVSDMKENARFFTYQQTINNPLNQTPSHVVIKDYIKKNGTDYRFETAENPIEVLRDRKKDDLTQGTCRTCEKGAGFKPLK